MELGVLTPQLFTMFVLMCLVTTAMAAPLLRLFLGRSVARWASVDGIDRAQNRQPTSGADLVAADGA